MTRRNILGRLDRAAAALEARRGAQISLPLEDGGTLLLSAREALTALGEAIGAVVAIRAGEPVEEPSPALRRLGHVRRREDSSLLGAVLVRSAHAVREHLEGNA